MILLLFLSRFCFLFQLVLQSFCDASTYETPRAPSHPHIEATKRHLWSFNKNVYTGFILSRRTKVVVNGIDIIISNSDAKMQHSNNISISVKSSCAEFYAVTTRNNDRYSVTLTSAKLLNSSTQNEFKCLLKSVGLSKEIEATVYIFVHDDANNFYHIPLTELNLTRSHYYAYIDPKSSYDIDVPVISIETLAGKSPSSPYLFWQLLPPSSNFYIDRHGIVKIQPSASFRSWQIFIHKVRACLFNYVPISHQRPHCGPFSSLTIIIKRAGILPVADNPITSTDRHLRRKRAVGVDNDGRGPDDKVFNISEDATNWMKKVADGIAHNQKFRLSPLNNDDMFSLSSDGELKVSAGRNLDYEKQKTYFLQVIRTTDSTAGKSTHNFTIRINVMPTNDENPIFTNKVLPMRAKVEPNVAVGDVVFRADAIDLDGSPIRYQLTKHIVDGLGIFKIDPISGEVRYDGQEDGSREQLRIGDKYQYRIRVTDQMNMGQQVDAPFNITVGPLEPQFINQPYKVGVKEGQPADTKVLELAVKSFQNLPIKFELLQEVDKFKIRSVPGRLTDASLYTARPLKYDKNERPTYNVVVRASEVDEGGAKAGQARTSTATVYVVVEDTNNNPPRFEVYNWGKEDVPENAQVNSEIVRVKAADDDDGENAKIIYSLEDFPDSTDSTKFIVVTDDSTGEGVIRVNGKLDYDMQKFHTYQFKVIATDQGQPPRSSAAEVRVKVTNVNDEPPKLLGTSQTVYVQESAKKGRVVGRLEASDLDGDGVIYKLIDNVAGGGNLFQIDESTGVVSLKRDITGDDIKTRTLYSLTINAADDGSCCSNKTGQRKNSVNGTLLVKIVDVNAKPTIVDCNSYAPKIPEDSPLGSFVIQVKATDPDLGTNNQLTYSLMETPDADNFQINSSNGNITTRGFFDHEKKRNYAITVKAEDQSLSQTKLSDFCTMRITISDVNDNTPRFLGEPLTFAVNENDRIGKSWPIRATDDDKGSNGVVSFKIISDSNMKPPTDLTKSPFEIVSQTGELKLKRTTSQSTNLEIMAYDNGKPQSRNSTTTVKIEVAESSSFKPEWTSHPANWNVEIDENVPLETFVASVKAKSSTPSQLAITYTLSDTTKPPIFKEFYEPSNDSMVIRTVNNIDKELVDSIRLTVKAVNGELYSEAVESLLVVNIRDVNDNYPTFDNLNADGQIQTSVRENEESNTIVATIRATDNDATSPNNQIMRYWISKKADVPFAISESGTLTTTKGLDREAKTFWTFTVLAEDGGSTPKTGSAVVKVIVLDVNDQEPEILEPSTPIKVSEDEQVNTVIYEIKAQDPDIDAQLRYQLLSVYPTGRKGTFGVDAESGQIILKRPLDYDNDAKEFTLTVEVDDGLNRAEGRIIIEVLNVNDNAPRFTKKVYEVRDFDEEQQGMQNLIQVKATDPDRREGEQATGIKYSLEGQFVDEGYFQIDQTTGQISVLKALNRDDNKKSQQDLVGRPVWRFNVLATDQPLEEGGGAGTADSSKQGVALTGYAEVKVFLRDINDNPPVFDKKSLSGSVIEHPTKGTKVMKIQATDIDIGENARITYEANDMRSSADGNPLFVIDPATGVVRTNADNPDDLDREIMDTYEFKIIARDNGSPSMAVSATATISLDDKNDHPPVFGDDEQTTMAEDADIDSEVIQVTATDADDKRTGNARLIYSLDNSSTTYFKIDNNGMIRVHKKPDYEKLTANGGSPEIVMTVTAKDQGVPMRSDEMIVKVTVTDANDNPPVIICVKSTCNKDGPNEISEAALPDSKIAQFVATDLDTGRNAEFTWRMGNHERYFDIQEDGWVVTRAGLDRETIPQYSLQILAVDKGVPQLTGSTVLKVTLTDVNDSPPTLAEDYRPVVMETNSTSEVMKTFKRPREVITIRAKDADTAKVNGPDGTPIFTFKLAEPDNRNFSLKANPKGDQGRGDATIYALREFDRERRKYYVLPIVISDGGSPSQTGTSSLTITIGDINDFMHGKGHKNIFAYYYIGWNDPRSSFRRALLGNTYAEDPDDWDVYDKTFSVIPEGKKMPPKMELDSNTGEIYMLRGVQPGVYNLDIKVYDRKFDREVHSTVTVTIQLLRKKPVYSAGSIRIQGTTAEAFIDKTVPDGTMLSNRKSQYEIFKELLAAKLQTKVENVRIFTVMNHPTMARTVDVRFAAHGSPWYHPSKLNMAVFNSKSDFEKKLGVKMLMTGINECVGTSSMESGCESGCTNQLIVDDSQELLINTNTSSFVGVKSWMEKKCTCEANLPGFLSKCTPNSCYNGGTCLESGANGFVCKCPGWTDGPRCQVTKQGFSGRGYALYDTLSSCSLSRTSFEFVTKGSYGLLIYVGPIGEPDENAAPDYMLVELVGGDLRLLIDLGSGELDLSFSSSSLQPQFQLNDGRWHRIDIVRNKQEVRLMVDRCSNLKVGQSRTTCEVVGRTPGNMVALNTAGPLQLGGRVNANYPQKSSTLGVNGCIKNFVHNSKLYDLSIGETGVQKNAADGCSAEDKVCMKPGGGGSGKSQVPVCGVNGRCIGSIESDIRPAYSCICKPGWWGRNCEKEAKPSEFLADSFIYWEMTDEFLKQTKNRLTEVELTVRTRDNFGNLFTATMSRGLTYQSTADNIQINIEDSSPEVLYKLGSTSRKLRLPDVNISDGEWHTVSLNRNGRDFIFKVDIGEGKYYVDTEANAEYDSVMLSRHPEELSLGSNGLMAGARLTFAEDTGNAKMTDKDSDLDNSCIKDVRFGNIYMPLNDIELAAQKESPPSLYEDSPPFALVKRVNMKSGCSDSNNCIGPGPDGKDLCPAPQNICVDLWRSHSCRCPTGQLYNATQVNCVYIQQCLSFPCMNGGTCVDSPGSFTCKCTDGYFGRVCGEKGGKVIAAGPQTWTVIIILVTLVFLLILVLCLAFLLKMRSGGASGGAGGSEKYILDVEPEDDVRENIIEYDEEGAGEEDQHAYDISRLAKPVGGGGEGEPYSPYSQLPNGSTHRPPHKQPVEERPLGSSMTAPSNYAPHPLDDGGEGTPHALHPSNMLRPSGEAPFNQPPVPSSSQPQQGQPPAGHPAPLGDVGDFINDRLDEANNDPNVPPFDSVAPYADEGEGSVAGSDLSSLQSSLSDADHDYSFLNQWGPHFNKLADLYGDGTEA